MAQQRWILMGDSIQSLVVEDNNPSVTPQAKNLAANLIPQLTNVSIQNVSAPGNRVNDIGAVGFGAVNYLNVINLISGLFGAQGFILTLGTNDWSNGADTTNWANNVRAIVDRAKSLNLKVVLLSPIWRSDQQNSINGHQLWEYAYMMQTIAAEKGVTFINGFDFGAQYGEPALYGDATGQPRVHLNTQGHSRFASFLVQRMQALGYWT